MLLFLSETKQITPTAIPPTLPLGAPFTDILYFVWVMFFTRFLGVNMDKLVKGIIKKPEYKTWRLPRGIRRKVERQKEYEAWKLLKKIKGIEKRKNRI